MRVLVGLGNPGPRYAATRHNLGYRVAESFAGRHGVRHFRATEHALVAEVRLGNQAVRVVKPTTFMNDSGLAVRAVAGVDVEGEDLVVAHDDLDLPLGEVRVKLGGGDGGQRGLRSILAELGHDRFARVRLGIQRPDRAVDAAAWVLEPFPPEEEATASAMVERGAEAAELVFRRGVAAAMNHFNRRERPDRTAPEPLAPPPDGGAAH